MKLSELIQQLETFAHSSLQESYDNAGLIVGNPDTEVSKAIICLDAIEAVMDEAIAENANLIIAHHPIIFSGLKKLNGKNYVERVVIKAIQHNIAIYAIHTNLDNVAHGVNQKIAEKLGLINCKILAPKKNLLKKLVTFVPVASARKVRNALFEAGAGSISNYDECSFNMLGKGTFKGNKNTNPTIGTKGNQQEVEEIRMELIFNSFEENKILKALFSHHPYEEVAYDIYALENNHQQIGAGLIGELENEMDELSFLNDTKKTMQTDCIRHSHFIHKKIKKVAVCGGSGSFLLQKAIQSGADAFITGDFKYHEFFDADNKILIADIGHYESEQFTIDLLYDYLSKKNHTFALLKTKINTNSVNYL
ncbi:MAG: hypothetical protein RI955_1682 [Bacteroidota bacterium]